MLLSQPAKQSADAVVLEAYADARDDVYYYVLTLGLTPAQAQDVTQEVFLKLYLQLRAGEEIRTVRAWVFRVAHNEGLKLKTKERNHAEITPDIEPVSPAGSPEARMVNRQSQARLRKALAELSPQQRQVLHLRSEGLRLREIAETIGIGTSTVNEFLRRAVTRLKRALHEGNL